MLINKHYLSREPRQEEGYLYKWECAGEAKQPALMMNYFSNLDNVKVMQMACGAGHVLVLTSTKQVFSWGCNRLG